MVKKAAPKNPAAKKPAAKKLEFDNSVAEMAVEAPRRRGRRPNAVSEEIPVAKESVSIKKNKKAGSPKSKAIALVSEKEPIEEEQPNQLVLQNSSLVDVPQPESHQLHSQVLKEVGGDGLPIVFYVYYVYNIDYIKDFSPDQKAAVQEIGFGGLLGLQLSRKNTQMMYWCIKCFDGVSSLFTISDSKQFEITDYDVYDLFMLPLSELEVEGVKRGRNSTNPDFDLKIKWRKEFGFEEVNAQIPIRLLEDKIKLLTDGGDLFKQLFVFVAFSTFFTPTANRTVDLRLAKALEDPKMISKYNWCKYVLDVLCEETVKFKNSLLKGKDQKTFGGCVVFLQLVYFQRIKFRNSSGIPDQLPLIQHWTSKMVTDRIHAENANMSTLYGSGILEKGKYPISKKFVFVDGQIDLTQIKSISKENEAGSSGGRAEQPYVGRRIPSRRPRILQFEIPNSHPTDEEIFSKATDDFHGQWLLMKRDLDVVSAIHAEELFKLKASMPSQNHGDDILENSTYQKMVDELVEIHQLVKNLPNGWDDIFGSSNNPVVTAAPQPSAVVPTEPAVVTAAVVDATTSTEAIIREVDPDTQINAVLDSLKSKDKEITEDDDEEIEEYERVWAGFQKCIINNHAVSRVNVSVYGIEENVMFMSPFMIAFEDLMRHLPTFVQEAVDFAALTDGEGILTDDKVIEYNHFIAVGRDDMWTLPSTFDILLIHIEAWAFLLNENERNPAGSPQKLFLGGTYCKYVADLIEKPGNEKILSELCVCLNYGVKDVNGVQSLKDCNMIFAPVQF
ncbi:uncharacterized protein [Spinacia oleracea]|uniref:DUF1985 domain-containing protein n=1 Tax=Spinacia oleracea TaxID=3562 RepID=A0ABM3RSF3_SPIOL|nr:uncharacterized protein LOC130472128 [Spinacia oleracea]